MTATDHTLFPFRNRLTQGVSINAQVSDVDHFGPRAAQLGNEIGNFSLRAIRRDQPRQAPVAGKAPTAQQKIIAAAIQNDPLPIAFGVLARDFHAQRA